MSYTGKEENLAALRKTAVALGDLREDVVFVGGATISLLITDKASPPIRVTEDVDIVVEAVTNADLQKFAERLRQRGFREDPDRSMCAFKHGDLLLDVMPSNPAALKWKGQWTQAAMTHCDQFDLGDGLQIKVAQAPCLLALKFDAFADRGSGDYVHTDIEDIIALIDGRRELIDEVLALQDDALRNFLIAQFRNHERPLLDFTPHHLGGGGLSRIPVVHERIRRLGCEAGDTAARGNAAMEAQAQDPVKKAIEARKRGEAKAKEAAARRDADWVASRDATLPMLKHLIPKLQEVYKKASPSEIGLNLHRAWLSRDNPALMDSDYSEVLESVKAGRLRDLVEIHCGMPSRGVALRASFRDVPNATFQRIVFYFEQFYRDTHNVFYFYAGHSGRWRRSTYSFKSLAQLDSLPEDLTDEDLVHVFSAMLLEERLWETT